MTENSREIRRQHREAIGPERRSITKMWRRFRRNKLALVGLVIVGIVAFLAVFAPVVAPHDPTTPYEDKVMLSPGSEGFILGTDPIGRDLLSRIIYGSRVSLQVGVIAVGIGVVIGVSLGLIAGYYGGIWDTLIMRLVDIFRGFPVILLAIAIMAVLGPSLYNVMIALGAVGWTTYARLVRGDSLSIREKEFVEAGRAIGLRDHQLLIHYFLPNLLAPIIVVATFGMATAILAEASLSFLGLGIQPPTPSWGSILADGRSFIRRAPHISIFPGLAIMFTILGFNFLGDGLRDALDPKQDR
ncbi:MAG: ABC transporter permease [Bacillota bacterium]